MALVNSRHLLIKARTKGVDPIADAILEGDVEHVRLYEAARGIWGVPVKKNYTEACMLAESDLVVIADLLEIPPDVLDMYRAIFFDVSGMNRLDKLVVVEEADEVSGERSLKMWAMSQGLEFIAWRLGKTVNMNPVECMKGMLALSAYKSKEAMFSGNSAESSKEAVKWVRMTAEIGKVVKSWVSDKNLAQSEIELALATIVPSFEGIDDIVEQDSFESLEDLDKF